MGLLLLWLSFLGSYTSQADKKGEVMCLGFENIEFVKIMNAKGNQQFPNYECDDFKSFDSLAGEVLELSPIRITNIDILVTKESPKDAGVDFKFNHLSFGFDKRRPIQTKSAVETIFIHELGHSIFTEYLYQKLPQLRGLNALRQLTGGSTKLLASFIELVDESGKCSSKKCLEFINQYGGQLERSQIISNQIHDWHKSNEDMANKLDIIIAPYHELVADIIVALFTQEPKSIRRAIYDVAGLDIPCRDFQYDTKLIGNEYSPHCVFSGIRRQLLSNILLPALESKTEAKALERIMFILASEIRSELETAVKTPHWQFDQQRAFNRLRDLLK